MRELTMPISPEVIRGLAIGEPVRLSGIMVTGRDTVHKWLVETFIRKTRAPKGDDEAVHAELKRILAGSMIYHCGPVVSGLDTGQYRFLAAGPTTSIREEPYEAEVMLHFGLRGVIGKGGMGPKTLEGCRRSPGVYLHAIGGAASLIAQTVKRVIAVHKLDFGVPEAIWVVEVEGFPAVVTMDANGHSQHTAIFDESRKVLEGLLERD
jgi:fumarate hydratase subunit beta